MRAKIIQQSKSSNQGAPIESCHWALEYAIKKGSMFNDKVTGWLSISDTNSEVKLTFPTLESAEEFAKSNHIEYEIIPSNRKKLVKRAYADNFK